MHESELKPGFAMSPLSSTQQWRLLAISDIVTGEHSRQLTETHVQNLQASFARLGGQLQLQPIVVDEELRLIDGAHRLEAARREGWQCVAGLVIVGISPELRPVIEVEANMLRRAPTLLELEAAWRTHYEPVFKHEAKRRRLRAPRQQINNHRASQEPLDVEAENHGVIGNTNNEPGGEQLSLSRAAKRITGLSIETLKKIGEIRALAAADHLPVRVRQIAARALTQLAQPRASVDYVHRSVREAIHNTMSEAVKTPLSSERLALEQLVHETSVLAERLHGSLAERLHAAASQSDPRREQLRAVRVSLTHALASLLAIEIQTGSETTAASIQIRGEVDQMLTELLRDRTE